MRENKAQVKAPVKQAIENVLNFPANLQLIMVECQISRAELARTLGEPRSNITHYLNDGRLPKEHLTYETVRLWAEKIERMKAERKGKKDGVMTARMI